MVVHFDVDADLLHRQHHLGADVLQRVHRRHREVPFFVSNLVAEVRRAFLLLAGVPEALRAVEIIEPVVVALAEADLVEHKEFRLRSEIGDIGDAGGLQIRLGFGGDVPRVARVRLTGDRILYITYKDKRRLGRERIEERGVRIREQQHVAFLDRLKSADAGAVEPKALFERVGRKFPSGQGEVLPDAGQVDEPQIHNLHALILGQLSHIVRSRRHNCPLCGIGMVRACIT